MIRQCSSRGLYLQLTGWVKWITAVMQSFQSTHPSPTITERLREGEMLGALFRLPPFVIRTLCA